MCLKTWTCFLGQHFGHTWSIFGASWVELSWLWTGSHFRTHRPPSGSYWTKGGAQLLPSLTLYSSGQCNSHRARGRDDWRSLSAGIIWSDGCGESAVLCESHGRSVWTLKRILTAVWSGLQQRAQHWFPSARVWGWLQRTHGTSGPRVDRGEVSSGPEKTGDHVIR